MRSTLRLAWHRGTTAHVASLFPFCLQPPHQRGVYIGVDLLAGGAEFCWDPFEAYSDGAATNPNGWVLGEPGNGKSALVKCLLWRMAAIYPHRWIAVIDPKGEYTLLGERLGLTVLRLAPGGKVRINPLGPGPADAHEPHDRQVLQRAELVGALVATVLERRLTQMEDAIIFAAVDQLVGAPAVTEPTLADVAALLADPSGDLTERLPDRGEGIGHQLAPVAYALDKLLSRSLRGMFDGPSTVNLHWDGPGLLLDISAIPLTSDALPLVMVATAGWLQQLMACPGPQRVQVLDEAWALLANPHTAGFLQSCFKLGRSYGVANLCITHRVSDLAAQADDGTRTSKIAAGLLADSATKIILRQAPDQVPAAVEHVGLTEPETRAITALARGRALWKIAGQAALVQHLIAPSEQELCDTDARMAG